MRKKIFIVLLFVSIILGFIMRINRGSVYEYAKAECCICGKVTKCFIVGGKYNVRFLSEDDDYSPERRYVCSLKCLDELRND